MRSLEPGISLRDRAIVGVGSSRAVTRRRLLGASVTLPLLLLAGCRPQPVAAPPPLEADEVSVNRAVVAAQRLRADALAVAGSKPALATLLHRVAAVHEQHLQALGAPAAPAGGSTSPPATGPIPSATGADRTPATSIRKPTSAELIKAETAAARAALRDGLAAAAPFAVLLCRIAAARVINADLLSAAIGEQPPGRLRPAGVPTVTAAPSTGATVHTGLPSPAASAPVRGAPRPVPTSPGDRSALDALFDTPDPLVRTPTPLSTTALDTTALDTTTIDPTPGARTTPTPHRPNPAATGSKGPADLRDPGTPALIALDRLLAGEHAAVFAYPLIIARTRAEPRDQATALWTAHRNERDQLSVRLLTAGVRSAVAEPAYDVGALPTTAAKAATLAARVEGGLAALATDLLAAGRPADADRTLGADHLVTAARRTARWTATPIAFPGRTSAESSTGESR
jgi:uncharacterized protein DUF4439